MVDALPVRHESGVVAAAYPREDAEAEAARFLADRPYLSSRRADEVLAVHRQGTRLTCGFSSSHPTWSPAAPSATGRS